MSIIKNNKIIFKPWNLIIIILIPVIIILFSNSINIQPAVSNQIYYMLGMIAALFGASHFLKIIITFIKAGKWHTAEAVIIESKVNKIDDNESIMYEPLIKYKYSVGSKEYCSSTIYPYDKFNVSTIKSHTVRFTDKYPKNKILKIFYNPLKPQDSYIAKKGIFPIIVFFLMFISTFILMMLTAIGVIKIE